MKKIIMFLMMTARLFSSCGNTETDQPTSSATQEQVEIPSYDIDTTLGGKAVKSIVSYAEDANMQSFVHEDDLHIFERQGISLSTHLMKITDDAVYINLIIGNGKTEISLDMQCPLDYSYPVNQKENITNISNLCIRYPSVTINGGIVIISDFGSIMFYDINTLDKIFDDISIDTVTGNEGGIFLCCTAFNDGYIAVYSSSSEEGLAVFDSTNNLKNKFTVAYKDMVLYRHYLSENSNIEYNLSYRFYGQRKIRCSEAYVYFEVENPFIADLSEGKIYKAYPLFSHTTDNRTVTVYSDTDIYERRDKCYVITEENDVITDVFSFDNHRMSAEFGADPELLQISRNDLCTDITAACDKTGMILNIDTEKHKAVISYNLTADMLRGYEAAATTPDGTLSLKYNISLYTHTRTVLCNNQTRECIFICNGSAYDAGFNPDGTIFVRTPTDYMFTDYRGNWLYSMAERFPYTDVSQGQEIYLCDVYRKEDGSYIALIIETGISYISQNYKLAVLDNNGNLVKVIDTGKKFETVKSFYFSPDIEIVDYNTVRLFREDRESDTKYFEILVELSTDYCEIIT